MEQNIQKRIISDGIIENFTDSDIKKLRKLERDYDFKIKVDRVKREVKFKGHILDIPNVQEKINEIMKNIKYTESDGKIRSVCSYRSLIIE